MTTIIDYGTGNIGSIANMLKKIGEPSCITADKAEIAKAERLVLCGVGSFDDGINKLEELGIIDVLNKKVLEDKTPILGICLGMQLFTKGSEEGMKAGLSWVDGFTRRFNFTGITAERQLRVPHMGWNEVTQSKHSKILNNLDVNSRFYFVHSYHVMLSDKTDELLHAKYGFPFTAAFEYNNIIGVQFHPEKSHRFGMKIFENFICNY